MIFVWETGNFWILSIFGEAKGSDKDTPNNNMSTEHSGKNHLQQTLFNVSFKGFKKSV